ncbi:MAG: VTT domain-containing protein [Anaerolineae bacterium]|nr:VTT domain-containing protein [Anaerolineae bacterium]
MPVNLEELIKAVGYAGLFAIVFAESGLFFGFFLPGDSLLLTAGLLAARGDLRLSVLLTILPVAAILGDSVGYWFGKRVGPPIFTREKSLLFRPKNLLAAKAFYEKHGGKTIVLARFMPFIRTFAPIVAGAADMHYPRFVTFNILGGLLWAAGVTSAGYFLGASIPDIDRYFLLVVAVVILVSAMPAMIHMWKEYRGDVFRLITSKWQALRARGDPPEDA